MPYVNWKESDGAQTYAAGKWASISRMIESATTLSALSVTDIEERTLIRKEIRNLYNEEVIVSGDVRFPDDKVYISCLNLPISGCLATMMTFVAIIDGQKKGSDYNYNYGRNNPPEPSDYYDAAKLLIRQVQSSNNTFSRAKFERTFDLKWE